MKRFYKIIILLIIFTFLTTYSPNELDVSLKKNKVFFKVENIEEKTSGDEKNNSFVNELFNGTIYTSPYFSDVS